MPKTYAPDGTSGTSSSWMTFTPNGNVPRKAGEVSTQALHSGSCFPMSILGRWRLCGCPSSQGGEKLPFRSKSSSSACSLHPPRWRTGIMARTIGLDSKEGRMGRKRLQVQRKAQGERDAGEDAERTGGRRRRRRRRRRRGGRSQRQRRRRYWDSACCEII